MRLTLRRFLSLVAMVLILGGVVVVTNFDRLRGTISRVSEREVRLALQAVVGPHLSFDSPRISLPTQAGGLDPAADQTSVHLDRLVVSVPGDSRPVVEAGDVTFFLNPLTVTKMESPEVTRVVLKEPLLRIGRSLGGVLNLAELAKVVNDYRRKVGLVGRPDRRPPVVVIENGTLELFDDALVPVPVQVSNLNLEITPEINPGGGTKFTLSGRSTEGMHWDLSGWVTLGGESGAIVHLQIKGRRITLDPSLDSVLSLSLAKVWQALEARGTVRELELTLDYRAGGDLTGSLVIDSSDSGLTLGLLEETIGERFDRLSASWVAASDGASFTASATRGSGELFEFGGGFGSLSPHPERDVITVEVAGLIVDTTLRDTIEKLEHIGRELVTPGASSDPAKADFDELWGEQLARSVFDPYQPRGILDINARVELPRGEGLAVFSGSLGIEEGRIAIPIGLDAAGERIRVPIEDVAGTIDFVGDDLTVRKDTRLVGRLGGAPISFFGRVTNASEPEAITYHAEVEIPDLDLDDELFRELLDRPSLGASGAWMGMVCDYQAVGRAGIEVTLDRELASKPSYSIVLRPLGDMSFIPPFFPYRIEGASGWLRLKDDRVNVDLRGHHQPEGGGRLGVLRVHGELNAFGAPGESGDLHVDADDLVIDEELISAIGTQDSDLAELLRRDLQAAGRIYVHVRHVHEAPVDGRPSTPYSNFAIKMKGCSAQLRGDSPLWQQFRYRIENLTGRIDMVRGKLNFSDVIGTSAAGDIFRIQGSLTTGDQGVHGQLSVSSPSLAFTDDLRDFLGTVDSTYIDLWQDLSPEGAVDFCYDVTLAGDEPWSTIVEIEPRGCTARAAAFPMPVRNITSGRVRIAGETITISDLTSRHDGATIVLDGVVTTSAAAPRVDLRVQARSLALDDELRQALPETVRSIWADFEPHGRVDVDATVGLAAPLATASSTPDALALAVEVGFLGVDARYRHLPAALSNVRGRIAYANRDQRGRPISRVDVRELVAGVLGGEIELVAGTVLGSDQERRANVILRGSELDLEHADLLRILPQIAPMRRLLAPAGRLGVDGVISQTGRDLASLSALGALSSPRLRIAKLELDDATAELMFENRVLHLPEIRAGLYGGTVRGSLDYDTSTFGAYDVALQVAGVDLKPVVAALMGSAPERLSGRIGGELELGGLGGKRESLTGSGRLKIEDGWLWELPVMLGILDSFGPSARPEAGDRAFRRCEATFQIADGRIRVPSVHVDANTLRISGRGTMDLAGGLDFQIAACTVPESKIPLISDLLSGVVAGSLIGLKIEGNARDPKLSVQPVKLVTDVIAGLADSVGADVPVRQP